jgi:hypothetical protein
MEDSKALDGLCCIGVVHPFLIQRPMCGLQENEVTQAG